MRYAHPGSEGAVVSFKSRYGNYINGQFVEPAGGQYFTNLSPVNGQPIAEFPRSDAADIEKALDAAHAAGLHASIVGRAGGTDFASGGQGSELFRIPLEHLREWHEGWMPAWIEG